ncbi:MAG: hypothetical protein JWO31_3705, partial [Phycisphaerales bacterium]|nr:hypothetical protein [Phycisphaerales bacterium]
QAYLRGGSALRCPGDADLVPDGSPADGFGDTPVGGSMFPGTSYGYAYVPAGGDLWSYGAWGPKGLLAGYERHSVGTAGAAAVAILHDTHDFRGVETPADGSGDAAAAARGHHPPAWNVLYLDGHVGRVRTVDWLAAVRTASAANPGGFPKAWLTVLDRAGG